jgi:valyl-tRNA synthetase
MNNKTFSKTWEPKDHEEKIYQNWEESGYFKPEINLGKNQKSKIKNQNYGKTIENKNIAYDRKIDGKPFVIPIPPPNVTGKLHIGHAMFVTLEDIMTRYHRLLGEPTLWIPGTDHAGIATQSVVDKDLRKKGINKADLGRDKFIEKVWEWKEEHGGEITRQIRRLGASCDWSRERFTLDEGLSEAVNEAFSRLYKKGLIYRGNYIVNWCPRCGSAISDDEVEHRAQKAKLYYFKYDKSFPITIASTRPETKLGDTAVAVNTSDERYKEFVGKEYQIELDGVKRTIKIIADRAVDKEFGTGALGVTPAHSPIDWKMAEENNLEVIKIIGEDGKMTAEAGDKYQGLSIKDARDKIISYLNNAGLMEKEEEIENNLAVCYRCETPIEPLPSLQWFVKMNPLAEKAKKAVESGEVKIIPKRFEKEYFHWMDNIRDWCISRQLWWGHRIPVYYRKQGISKSQFPISKQNENCDIGNSLKIENCKIENSSGIYIGDNPPEGWVQDPDVLDTWFSSALWPFSTLGWPSFAEGKAESSKLEARNSKQSQNSDDQKTPNSQLRTPSSELPAPNSENHPYDFSYFYPTSVLETGYDILFFWVARMIMMGLELTGKVPFHTVYLHGLVRDEHGRKMSKSLGNVLDPLDIIDEYGTDALRMGLVVGATPGQDVAVGKSKIKGYRNFSNKIWNASRFVTLRVSEGDLVSGELGAGSLENLDIDESILTDADKEVLKVHKLTKSKVKEHLDKYQFSLAGETLYDYFWHTFADVYIEATKAQLQKASEAAGAAEANEPVSENTKKILIKVLSETLVMLHPFVPFVTEAVWQELRKIHPKLDKSIMIAEWPKELKN